MIYIVDTAPYVEYELDGVSKHHELLESGLEFYSKDL